MGRYILGRLGGLLIAFVFVSMITFLLMHAVPGGPFDETKQPLPEAAKANILRKYGLDKPIWEQYLRYMWNAVHLDFGIPFQSPTETVTGLIARVWPPTLQLAGVVILLSYSLGLILGISPRSIKIHGSTILSPSWPPSALPCPALSLPSG